MTRLMGMSDEERLDFEQATGIKPETIEEIIRPSIEQSEEMLTRAMREMQEILGPHGRLSRVQVGGVVIDRGTGIGVFADGIKKTTIDVDGNLFVGSDIESPSTTTLSVFVNDQSYQGEEMGAGDLLIGDNTGANVFYDASATQLQFRDGTTIKAYVDTDGTFNLLAGTIGGWVIDSTSIEDAAGTVGMSSAVTGFDDVRFWAGDTVPEDAPFQVSESGALFASDANIEGTITAEDGTIGGWHLTATTMWGADPLNAARRITLDSSVPSITVGDTGGTTIVIDGANQRIRSSNFVTGASGFNISSSTGDAEFNNITARGELKTFLLTSSNQMAVGGNIIVSKDAGKLGADVTAIATTVNFGKAMTVGDWIKIQGPDSAGSAALEAMLVGSLVSGTTYNVTRNVDGSGANAWLKDTPFVVIGQNGTSRIELSAGASGSIQLITQGATYGTTTTQVSLSTSAGTMTAGAGDVTIDSNGIVFRNQEANLSFEDTSNTITTILIYSDGFDELVLKNAVGGKAIRFDIDDASHNVAQPYITYDGIFFENNNNSNTFQISNKAGTPTALNDGGADIDTYIETDANPLAFYMDAGENKATSFAWDGWQSMGYQTWTRTGNHTFTVATDVTAVYRKGTKVRYKDGGSYEYGVITSSSYSAPNTTVTLITNTDYTMAAATITDNYLSYIENPEGFPHWFAWDANPQGFSVVPSSPVYKWTVIGRLITLEYLEANNGTSNATTFTATAPVAPANATSAVLSATVDNGALTTTPGRVTLTSGSTLMTFRVNTATGAWTNANGKRAVVVIAYEY